MPCISDHKLMYTPHAKTQLLTCIFSAVDAVNPFLLSEKEVVLRTKKAVCENQKLSIEKTEKLPLS